MAFRAKALNSHGLAEFKVRASDQFPSEMATKARLMPQRAQAPVCEADWQRAERDSRVSGELSQGAATAAAAIPDTMSHTTTKASFTSRAMPVSK